MKKIYFVRHGESTANLARIHGGGQHPLTEKGVQQAKFIAERCASLPVQSIITSTMVRAEQTGKVIADKLNLPFETSDLLVEVFGPSRFMEKPVDDPEAITTFKELNSTYKAGYRLEDEENFDDLVKRAGDALALLAEKDEEHIVVVTHGLFLRVLMAYVIFGKSITGPELAQILISFKSQNSGLTIFDYASTEEFRLDSEYPWRIFVWNDHAHLG